MEVTRDILAELFKNKILIVTFYSWLIAQSIKVILGVIREKRFNFRWLVGTGGMPSSHAATVSALGTGIGFSFGFDSALFAIAFVFAVVVIMDAQGVRRSTGKQAEILNKMLEDIYWKKHIQEGRLHELLGHTPIQVITGIILGIATTTILW